MIGKENRSKTLIEFHNCSMGPSTWDCVLVVGKTQDGVGPLKQLAVYDQVLYFPRNLIRTLQISSEGCSHKCSL